MAKLFDKDSDSDGELNFNTETQYAKKYDSWRQKEIIETLKARYGDQGDDSTSSEEDDIGIELTPQVEKDFFRTLACLKKDDEIVYEPGHKFFAPRDEEALARAKSDKPMFLREFERRRILEHGGIDIDEEDPGAAPRSESPTLAQEQRDLKAAFRTALDSDSDSDSESLLVPRKRGAAEKAAEDVSYAEWLRGNAGRLPDDKEEAVLKPLRDFWTDPKLDKGEAFLKDYVLGRRYLASNEIPEDALELSEDEAVVNSQEDFERSFNFRFEEPDSALIKTYPRTMENSMRQKDTRRKEKRQATKIRHEQRREQQVQELMQLKALKRKEIQERIEALKKVTGNDSLGFQDSDIEGDFNPSKHDQRMDTLFAEPYYADAAADEEKPEFSDLDDEPDLERWDEFAGRAAADGPSADRSEAGPSQPLKEEEEEEEEEEEGPHCEDAEFNMDADYDPATAPAKKQKLKRKRKVPALWTALNTPHPTFDPKQGTFDAFVDEYYKLDFEDIIGDLPCRFKYRQVVPNDFGLTIDEILRADDKELNAWASLKKATRIRPEWLETKDQDQYARRGKNEQYKRKILTSLYQPEEKWEGPDIPGRPVWTGPKVAGPDQPGKKRKKAGGKRKRGLVERGDKAEGKEADGELDDGEVKKKKKKHRHEENGVEEDIKVEMAGDDSECATQNEEGKEKKKKKKKHHHEENGVEEDIKVELVGDDCECATKNEEGKKKKKKKKHRHEENGVEEDIKVELDGSECATQNGEGTKKKKKKKHHNEENGVEAHIKVELAGDESEFATQNGEGKKKKKNSGQAKNIEEKNIGIKLAGDAKQSGEGKKKKQCQENNGSETERGFKLEENGSGSALQNADVKKKKEKKKQQKEGAIATAGGEGGLSRRQKKSLKAKAGLMQKKPKKMDPKDRNFKREKRRLAKMGAEAGDAERLATEKRLAAYGLPRPKRFLGYLKHKDGGTGTKNPLPGKLGGVEPSS